MNNEEKILGILSSMQADLSSVHGEISSMRGEMSSMRGEMSSMRGEMSSMQADLSSVHGEISSIHGDIAAINRRLDTVIEPKLEALETSSLKTNIKIEADIETKIGALADGHTAILERMVPRTRMDDLESEVRFLKSVMFRMNDELEQLKKAQ